MASIPPDRVLLALDAIDRLMRIYRWERAIYLLGATAGTAMVLYAAFLFINEDGADKTIVAYFFGAGGLFSVAGGYTLRLLNKSFSLIRDVLLPQGTGPTP